MYFFLQEYTCSSSCPGSPTLPDKNSLSASNAASLAPHGTSPTSTLNIIGSGKRRGIGHRASYKRAHTGRLVCISVFFSSKQSIKIIF